MSSGQFDVESGNGWLCGKDKFDFVCPEDFNTWIMDHALVPGDDLIDEYFDLPFPQIPDGSSPCYGYDSCGGDPTKVLNPNGVSFNTLIKRMTRSGYDNPEYKGAYVFNSEVSYWNKSGTKLCAIDWDASAGATNKNTPFLFDQNGKRLRRLHLTDFSINDNFTQDRFRWAKYGIYNDGSDHSFNNDNVFYFLDETNGLEIYQLTDNGTGLTLLHTFTWVGYQNFYPAGGEGDIDYDGRYWVIGATKIADGEEYLFRINLYNGTKGTDSNFVIDISNIDYARISPSGTYIIVSWHTVYTGATDTGIEKGLEIYNGATFARIRTLIPGVIHWDLYKDGNNIEWCICGRTHIHNTTLWDYHNIKTNLGDYIKVRIDSNTLI